MSDGQRPNETIPISRIFLSLENPRHAPVDSEAKAIARLCEKENIYQLARDIAKHGLNPLERFALIPTNTSKKSTSKSFFVAEGNRRICAIKLLTDPDLAPLSVRKSFEKLSSDWEKITSVSGVIFQDISEVDLWLDRIHSGEQNGRGRKNWNSEQKSRFDGENKNRVAQAILDYAERKSMISAQDRIGKLTTAQRFLNNDVFRETLGIDTADPDELGRNRPEAEFDAILKKFIGDLVDKVYVHSRMNKVAIIDYARPLGSLKGVTSARVQVESLTVQAPIIPKRGRLPRPKMPEKVARVAYQDEVAIALKLLGNEKFISLYHSMCTIELDPHTPIVAVGTWSFFETLTACAGRSEKADFTSFLSKDRLTRFGFTGDTVSYRSAMDRIREYGTRPNITRSLQPSMATNSTTTSRR